MNNTDKHLTRSRGDAENTEKNNLYHSQPPRLRISA
jgi:hypothetical protein